MKKTVFAKILVVLLAVMMLVSALPLAASAADAKVLAGSDLTAFSANDKTDGQEEVVGDFTIYWSTKSKVEADKDKKFGEEKLTGRINFGGGSAIGDDGIKNAIKFTTTAAATVKIWWVQGGNKEADPPADRKPVRNMAIYGSDYALLTRTTETAETSYANDAHISELSVAAAGTYYLATEMDVGGSNYIFKVEVTEQSGSSETPSNPVTPPAATADNSAIFAMMAIMAVSMAAMFVFGKKAVR